MYCPGQEKRKQKDLFLRVLTYGLIRINFAETYLNLYHGNRKINLALYLNKQIRSQHLYKFYPDCLSVRTLLFFRFRHTLFTVIFSVTALSPLCCCHTNKEYHFIGSFYFGFLVSRLHLIRYGPCLQTVLNFPPLLSGTCPFLRREVCRLLCKCKSPPCYF